MKFCDIEIQIMKFGKRKINVNLKLVRHFLNLKIYF